MHHRLVDILLLVVGDHIDWLGHNRDTDIGDFGGRHEVRRTDLDLHYAVVESYETKMKANVMHCIAFYRIKYRKKMIV